MNLVKNCSLTVLYFTESRVVEMLLSVCRLLHRLTLTCFCEQYFTSLL